METTDFALFSSLFEDLANEFQESTYGGANSALQSEPQHSQHGPWPLQLATSLTQAPVNAPIPLFTAPQSLPGSTAALPWGPLPPGIQPPPLTNLPTFPFGVPSLPDGLFSASQSISVPITEGNAASGRRKRGPSVQDQVAALTATLHLQETIARNLARNNIWLLERNNIMEKVIKAAEHQTAHLGAIQAGLKFDPMVGLHTTYDVIHTATPHMVATFVQSASTALASKLAVVEPLLRSNPHLITGTRSSIGGKHGPVDEPLPRHLPLSPHVKDTKYQHLLPELDQLLKDGHQMLIAWAFLYLTKPEFLQASSIRLQAMQQIHSVSWEALRSAVQKSADNVQDMEPSMAPEGTWVKLIKSLTLTDHQRLRMAVLWDIIDKARKLVLRQRAQLADALAEVLQAPSSFPASHAQVSTASHHSHSSGTGVSTGLLHASGEWSQASQAVQGAHQQHVQHHDMQLTGPRRMSERVGKAEYSSVRRLSATGVQTSSALGSGLPRVQRSISLGGEASAWTAPTQEAQAKAAVWKGADALQREIQMVQRLQRTVIKERCLVMLACEVMFGHIFSPVQNVLGMVSMYPYMPDQMAIMYAGAAEFQPDVLERLVTAAYPDLD